MDKDVLGGVDGLAEVTAIVELLDIRDRFEDYPCAPLPDTPVVDGWSLVVSFREKILAIDWRAYAVRWV